MDLSRTPLTQGQIALLAIAGAGFFHNRETGETFVSKRYWRGINQPLREALVRMVSGE